MQKDTGEKRATQPERSASPEVAPRSSLQMPRKHWYPAALSGDVTRTPRRVMVLGDPFVVYRNKSGAPVAHLDRCPHRNVPLSTGRCRDDDTIECPYHGWRFAADGACQSIPGLVTEISRGKRVETFATLEQYGIVWLCPAESGLVPDQPPLAILQVQERRAVVLVRRVSFPAGLHAVLENALDVPHTSVLHRGLFRAGNRTRVQVLFRRYRSFVEAEYVGESAPRGLVARLLSFGSGSPKSTDSSVRHVDRFHLPSALQVEYRLGARVHLLITGYCTPIDEHNTDVFAVVCLSTPFPQFLVRSLVALLEPLARRVVKQDVALLKRQTDAQKHFGGASYMSTEIDVLGAAITRLLKESMLREGQTKSVDSSTGGEGNMDPLLLRESRELILEA